MPFSTGLPSIKLLMAGAMAITVMPAVLPLPAAAEEALQMSVDDLQYRRYERSACGIRKVTHATIINATFELPEDRVNDVAGFSVSYSNPDDTDGFEALEIPLVRTENEIRVGYPEELLRTELDGLAAIYSICNEGNCGMQLPIYISGEFINLVPFDGTFAISAYNEARDDIATYTAQFTELGVDESALIPNNFKDFSIIVEPDIVIVEPLPGHQDAHARFQIEIEDSNGVRELDLSQENLFNDNYWVIPWSGDLNYLQVTSDDSSGTWENVVEPVDKRSFMNMNAFGGTCYIK